MANEITHNAVTGLTLYFCRFQQDGDVFLSNPATDEVWGTGGRTAADYDVAMTEEDASGHYKGTFATGGAIAAGVYQVTVFRQTGAGPANSPTDVAIAQGEIYWDGTAESTLQTIINKLPDDYIMGSSVTTSMNDEIDDVKAGIIPLATTVAAASTTTSFTLTAGVAVADAYNDMAIMIKDATDSHWEERTITDWTAARVVTVDTAFGFTPAIADVAWIKGSAYGNWSDVTTLLANTGKVIYGSVTGTGGIPRSIQTGSATGFVEDEKL